MNEQAPTSGPSFLRRATGFREGLLLMIIFVAGGAMASASPVFLTRGNLLALLLGISVEAIIAIGMTILLVSGGFDLSVGSVMALCGAVAALGMKHGFPIWLAIFAALGLGCAVGLLNGTIIAKVGINPFITTLGMMSIARGALLVMTQGQNITGLPDGFDAIGQNSLFGIQYPIIIAVVMVIAGDLLLRKSRFFRQNYYIGGNEKAAILSGIPVNRVKIFNYALSGFLAAAAGIVYTSRFGSASATAGLGLELRVISAVVIGGASLQGGEGTVAGSFLGSLLMGIIVGSLTLLNVDVYWTQFVIGATLLAAVTADTLGRRRIQ